MSRDPGENDEGSITYEMWEHNLQAAINGKFGQRTLRRLREALLALPEHRLIDGALCTLEREHEEDHNGCTSTERHGAGVCILGAHVWYDKVQSGLSAADAFKVLPTFDDANTQMYESVLYTAEQTRMRRTMAYELAYMNDITWECVSPEDRWRRFMAWLDEHIVEVAA